MNKTTLFLSLFGLFLINYAFAQEEKQKISIEWNEELTAKDLPYKQMFSLTDHTLLIYGHKKQIGNPYQPQLSILDEKLNILQSKEIYPSYFCEKCKVEEFFHFNKRYYFLLKSSKSDHLKIVEVNPETLELKDTGKTFEKVKTSGKRVVFSAAGQDGKFYFRGYFQRKLPRKPALLKVDIYDQAFNLLKSNQTKLAKGNHYFDFAAGKEGQCSVLINKKGQKPGRKGRIKTFWFPRLYTTAVHKEEFEILSIPPDEEKKFADLSLKASANGDAYLIYGQYYDNNIKSNGRKKLKKTHPNNVDKIGQPTVGRIGFTYSEGEGLSEKYYSPFEATMLQHSFEEKNRAKNNEKFAGKYLKGVPELYNTRIDSLPNGDYVSLAEVYTVLSSPGAPSGPLFPANEINEIGEQIILVGAATKIYLGKIVLSVLSPDGQTKWMRSIDRIQMMEENENLQTDFILHQNKIGVIYVDGKSSYINFYDIEKGTMEQRVLDSREKNWEAKVQPSYVKKINENRWLLYRKKKDQVKFGLLRFE